MCRLLTWNDEQGHVQGQVVIAVSGKADYVDGLPKNVTLSDINDDSAFASYYHKSVVDELKKQLHLSRTSAEILQHAVLDK